MDSHRYIIIGGNPFTDFSGSRTFTGLKIAFSSDDLEECNKKIADLFDECGGLLLLIDTHTNEVV